MLGIDNSLIYDPSAYYTAPSSTDVGSVTDSFHQPPNQRPSKNINIDSSRIEYHADKFQALLQLDLQDRLNQIKDNIDNNDFNKKKLVSSNSNLVNGELTESVENQEFTIQINSIAQQQIVVSDIVSATGKSKLNPGLYTYNLTTPKYSKPLKFEVIDTDTNIDILRKIGKSIISEAPDMEAKLERLPNEQVRLHISSNKGTANRFQLDLPYGCTTDQLAASDQGGIQQPSTDASVIINQTPIIQSTNTLLLANGKIQLQLQDADPKPITCAIGPDIPQIQSQITDTLNNINSNLEYFLSLGLDYFSQISSTIKSHQETLKTIGIDVNSLGFLSVNDQLDQALTQNFLSTEFLLTGQNGFFNDIKKTINANQPNLSSISTLPSFEGYSIFSSLV